MDTRALERPGREPQDARMANPWQGPETLTVGERSNEFRIKARCAEMFPHCGNHRDFVFRGT